ncbi:MAG: PIG-L family deacetylase, partial [bacterium]|nr:PIG-L family deacetylase [Candidatus Kapabacteria bacterium]
DVIFLTSGEAGGHGRSRDETLRMREAEAATAAQILGIGSFDFWREPDGALEASPKNITRMYDAIMRSNPDTIFVTHSDEMHADHRAAEQIVRAAVGMCNGNAPNVLMYEVWTPMSTMDHIEDITAHMPVKLEAVRAYRSQCDVMAFDEAIAGLNRYRGEMHSWPGGPYAEVFREMKL